MIKKVMLGTMNRAELDLHDLHVCMIFNPLDKNESPAPNWSRDLAFSRCAVFFFFFTRGSVHCLLQSAVEQGVQT